MSNMYLTKNKFVMKYNLTKFIKINEKKDETTLFGLKVKNS